jgi:hypothetical protein
MILTNAGSITSLPSVEIFLVAAENVAMLKGALAAEYGFDEFVASEDKVENVTLALPLLEGDSAAGAPARHSALMIVILSHPGVLGISFKALYQ